ncbi:translation initiation factor SUI1, partial [Cantharellus anzutake]|uniref:translation initiation factor SUI1 n=1 Tax=Cantharellus anzutake TaxID=1750568 RepID=UPI001906A36B
VCGFPPEYCEFGSSVTRCKKWLEETHPDIYPNYYSEDALASRIGTLSLEAQEKLEQEAAKKEAKAQAKADADAKKKQVTIKRIERTKKKHVTAIHNLDAFGIDLKKAAKLFAQRFAAGASVSKNTQGQDEIVIQGDVSDEVVDMLEEANAKGPGTSGVSILAGVPADNVVLTTDKKKKAVD